MKFLITSIIAVFILFAFFAPVENAAAEDQNQFSVVTAFDLQPEPAVMQTGDETQIVFCLQVNFEEQIKSLQNENMITQKFLSNDINYLSMESNLVNYRTHVDYVKKYFLVERYKKPVLYPIRV